MKTDRNIVLAKKNLRKKLIALRDALPENQRNVKSRVIASKFLNIKNYEEAKNILLFYPFGSEIDTRLIIFDALQKNKKVILPKIIAKKYIELYFVGDLKKELKPGTYNIMEPSSLCQRAFPEEVDLAVIPGVCFDKNFNRLGYGGGFYDQLIPQLRKMTLKISPCFDMQLVENIPVYAYDMKINVIITEKKILKDSNN